MKLKSTREEYRFEDASGYSFDVVADYDPELGWSASVTMSTHGLVSSAAAVEGLADSAKQFLRQLKDAKKEGA